VSARPLRQLDDEAELAAARQAFIAAALEIVTARETLDLGVADVVRRSGWHNAAFYRIFGSKDGLLLAVSEEATRRTVEVLRARVARARTPSAALRVWTAVLLQRAASAPAATATQPFALDRHRLLHRFPDAEQRLTLPIRAVVHAILREAGCPDAESAGDAATELVLGQQATWLACRHRPTPAEIEQCTTFVQRLVGLPTTTADRKSLAEVERA
jgi:AcrR family transcriptional regulator